jgi:glutamate dehydrogenase/leucine dehydrogenase
MTEEDVQYLLTLNEFFIGRTGFAGDPSPYASRSVFEAIKTSLPLVFNTDSLVGLKVAIKGVGKVGSELARLLSRSGAEVYVADIDKNQLRSLQEELPSLRVVPADRIAQADVDVFSPCALGGDLHTGSLPGLKAKLICGGANNQLASLNIAQELHGLGKIYVPDVLANAGGLINVVDELEVGGYQSHRVTQRIMNLQDTLRGFFATSFLQNKPLAVCLEEYVHTTLAAQSRARQESLVPEFSVNV